MTSEIFFAKFDELAETPGAVAKMRNLVLGLAIQGKIVAQDPADSALDEDVQSSLVPSIPGGPIPIPATWKWVQLGEVSRFINGDRSKNYPSKGFRVDSGVPFINAGHLGL